MILSLIGVVLLGWGVWNAGRSDATPSEWKRGFLTLGIGILLIFAGLATLDLSADHHTPTIQEAP